MKERRLLVATEVAVMAGISLQTLNIWYVYKRQNPDSEYAKKLPEYIQEGEKQTRYWRIEDVYKLIEFKAMLPHGRNGIMGDITQKYYRKEKENGKK